MPYIGPRERAELRKLPKPPFFPTHPHWRQCVEQFLGQISRTKSKNSRQCYDGFLRWFFADAFTDPRKTPDHYTEADVLAFISQPTNGPNSRGKEPKAGTINARLSALKSFYKFASRYRIPWHGKTRVILQAVDPTEQIKFMTVNTMPKTISDDELTRFFAAIDTTTELGLRDRCIFLFYFYCGRRKSAVGALRYGDVERAPIQEKGKQREGWVYHFREKGGKIGSAELPQPVVDALDAYLVATGRKGHMCADTPLFLGTVNTHEGEPLSGKAIDHRFRRYAKLAGISTRHSIHSFRHTAAARRWEEMGDHKDLLELMRFLGHSDPKMTLRYLSGITYEADTLAQRIYQRYQHL